MPTGQIVVVSNRLPVSIQATESGTPRIVPSSGGLVTALRPLLQKYHGRWIGWAGGTDDAIGIDDLLAREAERAGFAIVPVSLTPAEVTDYYHGFANGILWPLFHDMVSRCDFRPDFWPAYQAVNEKFARTIAERTNPHDLVWIHDYHLMTAASELRKLGVARHTAHFLHIPFPPPDVFMHLPWREQLIAGMLGHDFCGFQTQRDLVNFIECVRKSHPKAELERDGSTGLVRFNGRETRLLVCPISIPYQDFLDRAISDEVSEIVANIRARLPGRRLILGVDRLDYSKGIPERIEAFAVALQHHPELRGAVTLLQVVVPSRTNVEEYRDLKNEIDRLVGHVNGRFAVANWTPIQYIFRSIPPNELLAYYRVADVALVTPLKDGMNLVAKEYCACSLEDDGVLILSEFAGAADELGHAALLVNPHDAEGTAAAIHNAITMKVGERRTRMRQLRSQIRESDVHAWMAKFLRASGFPGDVDSGVGGAREQSSGLHVVNHPHRRGAV